MRKARDADTLRDVLGSHLEDLQRMSMIVQDMLFLSQADRGAEARREHVASLAGVARAVVELHEAAIEEMFFGKNVTAAITVAQGRGVTLLALADAGLKIREYKPAEVKQTIAGSGNAPKPQMQEMVRALLNLEKIPKPDDAADALAIAITALQSSRWERLIDS